MYCDTAHPCPQIYICIKILLKQSISVINFCSKFNFITLSSISSLPMTSYIPMLTNTLAAQALGGPSSAITVIPECSPLLL